MSFKEEYITKIQIYSKIKFNKIDKIKKFDNLFRMNDDFIEDNEDSTD